MSNGIYKAFSSFKAKPGRLRCDDRKTLNGILALAGWTCPGNLLGKALRSFKGRDMGEDLQGAS